MRRDYEDVMDVKLRATLKELGFERKGAATYVFERPRVTWFFELERGWDYGFGPIFYDALGVFDPEVERIFRDVLENDWVRHTEMRSRCYVGTRIPRLVEIELEDGPTQSLARGSYKRPPKVDSVIEYYWKGAWRPRHDPAEPTSPEERERLYRERIAEFGPYFDEMFRRYALPWFQMSEKPKEFAQWYENYTVDPFWPDFVRVLCAIVVHHIAGNRKRAKELIQQLIAEGDLSFEELLRDVHDQKGIRSWMFWPVFRSVFKPEQYEENARADEALNQIGARKARRLAEVLGY